MRSTTVDTYLEAALRLHQYIINTHWDGKAIVGPDPIGKIHWRITRFVRSYFPWLPGDDRYIYLQGQAYWIKGNLALLALTQEPQYLELAERCADYIVQSQPANGAWLHPPIRGRRGFISTVEGVWASLGLTAAYRKMGKQAHLDSALKWYTFQINDIGFQEVGGGLATNYYAHSDGIVPNVTTMLIWLTAELYQITEDKQYLKYTEKMLRFIEHSQLDSGELPYALERKTHFMCYQYNSFQFLDLAHYYQLTGNGKIRQMLSKMAAYLATGVTERGSSRYNCFKEVPEVNYWTAVLAAALYKAHELELGDYVWLSQRAYRYLLTQQRPDGGFDFSARSYGLLRDRRSYPRYLAMILNHLLYRAAAESRDAMR
jgi:rhamnogalacturonyl hydrolase YesR